ncbi:TPA: hypothetical protein AABK62_11070 [Neisseria gonorrhoeae]
MGPRFKKVRHCTFFKQDFQSADAPAIGAGTVLWHNRHTNSRPRRSQAGSLFPRPIGFPLQTA